MLTCKWFAMDIPSFTVFLAFVFYISTATIFSGHGGGWTRARRVPNGAEAKLGDGMRFWSILIDFDRFQWCFDVVWCCLWLGMLGIMRHPVTCSLVIRRWLQIQGVLQGILDLVNIRWLQSRNSHHMSF
jgi:hypothetical protein